ncbi:MAG: aldehyde dehydrogenase [Pseudorhodoplanes sp.]
MDDMTANAIATRFLAREHRMLVDGQWVPAKSGKTFDVYNPATGEVIGRAPEGDKADIEAAVAAARRAFDQEVWWGLGPEKRGRILWRIGDLINQHGEELANLESINNGMLFKFAHLGAIPLIADTFRYYAGWATKIHGKTSEILGGPMKSLAYTLKEPIGVVGLIAPWNAPLLIASWQAAPALAAGCTCVLKPAEETPLSILRLGELMLEAGIPPGVVNIVTGFGHTAGAALSAHNDVDKVSFTGSTEVGRLILQAAGGNLKKVALELGGKSPVVVFDDADASAAIPGAARAIFNNAGQVCTAGSRLYVQRRKYDEVIEGVADIAKKIKVGPGLAPESEMGPLISKKQLERVTGYVQGGVADGAQVVTGGQRAGNQGYFMQPTVLSNTNPDMKVVQEEIFGPVVCAMPFDDLDEIAKIANDTPYGLAGSIWTKDLVKAHTLARKIRAGSLGINIHSPLHPSMPRGGYKQSGWGRENSLEGLEAFLETKTVYVTL